MADTSNIQAVDVNQQQSTDLINEIKKEEKKKQEIDDNVLLYAVFQILSAVNIQQESTGNTVKSLQFEVSQQAQLNNMQAQLKFQTLPTYNCAMLNDLGKFGIHISPKASATELNEMTDNNEVVNAQRGYVTNQITIDQQNSQVNSTKAGQQIDSETQGMQTASGLLDMAKSISDQIGSMAR